MVGEVAKVHVIRPVQGVSAAAGGWVTEISLPGVVITPIEDRSVSMRDH
jgi:hypothetical protein